MGGSSGTTTSTQTNTPWNAAQLADVQNKAVDLSRTVPINYYPGQSYASPNDAQNTALEGAGYLGLTSGIAAGGGVPKAQTDAIANNNNLANGSSLSAISPFIGDLVGLGASNPANAGINALNPIANGSYYQSVSPQISALANLSNGTAAQDLASTAGGAYLNSNPYLSGMVNAAAQPVINSYMTATAPQTDSAFERAGRYNSGSSANATSVNQQNLGTTLNNLTSQIYGQDYQNERGLMNQAATSLGSLQNSDLSSALSAYNNQFNTIANAAGNVGSLGVSGAGQQTNSINSGVGDYLNAATQQLNAINATPALSNMPYTDYSAALNAGTQAQQQQQAAINDAMQRYYGIEMSPYATLSQEASIVGSGIPGTSTLTQPYFTNTGSQIAGGLGAAASIGKTLLK